jgi:hypothetical protein
MPLPPRAPVARVRPTLLRTRLLAAGAAIAAAGALALPSQTTHVRSATGVDTATAEQDPAATRLPALPDRAERAAAAAAAAVGGDLTNDEDEAAAEAPGAPGVPRASNAPGAPGAPGASDRGDEAAGGTTAPPRPGRHTRQLAAPRPTPTAADRRDDRVAGGRGVVPPVHAPGTDERPDRDDATSDQQPTPGNGTVTQAGEASAELAVDAEAAEDHRTPLFATVGKVNLRVPSEDEVLLGFHQAAFRTAMRMEPVTDDATPLRTLPSRGRPTPSRSAVDVSVTPGTPVLSPVTGQVRKVKPYALYGKYPDSRVEIRPKADPSKKVTVLHVTEPTISPGDDVVGGETKIAQKATQLPFESQIDRYAGELPHVHVEVAND